MDERVVYQGALGALLSSDGRCGAKTRGELPSAGNVYRHTGASLAPAIA